MLNSCNNAAQRSGVGGELFFKTDSISVIDPGCKSKIADDCSYVKMRFPVFSGKGARYLNQQVALLLRNSQKLILNSDEPLIAKNANALAPAFFKERLKQVDQAGIPDDENTRDINTTWVLDGFVEADTSFTRFITLIHFQQAYTGGAHGSYFTEYHLFDPASERPLTITDFLKNTSDTTALKTIAQASGVWLNGKGEPSFLESDEVPFFLNWDNFYFNKQGMVFKYQIYEVASYAEGSFDLLMPFEKLRGVLKTDYLPEEKQ